MKTDPIVSPAQQTEWLRQEQAFDAERGAAGTEAPASYRLIARALREPLPVDLPADFATRVARRAETAALLDPRWERRGIAVLLGTLAVLAGAGLLLEGASWLADLQAALPSLPRILNGWTLLLLAGLAAAQLPVRRPLR
ncbi:MAG TPA: hypothetical protein VLF18_12065 [Tahibacter sp.]|uniref:hypothetical protein n=1 Tax=Tahibacter sp. TaxID=2056211 RepID=UPI002D06A8CC|nr:hypothetical protein [Tahibacter sp.]HSX60928.1 hypothetical protein [Tahibacter sp.]